MLDTNTGQARVPATRGGPASTSGTANVMRAQDTREQQEKLSRDLRGLTLAATDYKKDFKRSSLLQ